MREQKLLGRRGVQGLSHLPTAAFERLVADSTHGLTLMLAGSKALLEHNIRLNLTLDRYRKGIEEQVVGA